MTLALAAPPLARLPIAPIPLPTILPSTDRNLRYEMSFTDPRQHQEYAPSRGVIEDLRTVSGKEDYRLTLKV